MLVRGRVSGGADVGSGGSGFGLDFLNFSFVLFEESMCWMNYSVKLTDRYI